MYGIQADTLKHLNCNPQLTKDTNYGIKADIFDMEVFVIATVMLLALGDPAQRSTSHSRSGKTATHPRAKGHPDYDV